MRSSAPVYGRPPDNSSPYSVRDSILFDVEADFGLWGRWRRLKQGPELLVDVAQRAIVQKEGLINFGKALQDDGVGGKVLAHFDESADDINAHGDGTGAVEDVGSHKRAVLGEGNREVAAATVRS